MSQLPPHVLTHEWDTGWAEMVSRQPAPALRSVVRRYTGYREHSDVPVRRKEMPFGSAALILSFGPRISVLRPGSDNVLARPESFVATIGTDAAVTEYTGSQYGVQIVLTPIGASMVLGVPLGDLGPRTVEFTDVLGAPARMLLERLAECAGWPDRFDELDRFLCVRLSRARRPSPVASFAWRRLCQTDGLVSIGSLVRELNCSHRYLLSEFESHVGVGPKAFARLLRARRASGLIAAGTKSLREIAVACGYSDQAHLSREFRAITGDPPSLWYPGMLADAPEAPEL